MEKLNCLKLLEAASYEFLCVRVASICSANSQHDRARNSWEEASALPRREDGLKTKSALVGDLADFPSVDLATDSAVSFALVHIVRTYYLRVNGPGFST